MTYTKLSKLLKEKVPSISSGLAPNQYAARPLFLEATVENEPIFNEIYYAVKSSDLDILQRSKSGSIRRGPRYLSNLYAYDVRTSSIGLQLTVVIDGFMYVIKYGNYKGSKCPEIFPNVAFNTFNDKCIECGIDLRDYAISNGAEVKKEIPAPYIEMYVKHTESDKGLSNVHHIDFHNSYPAGLVNTHPEFRPVVEYFYNKRKEDPVYKAVLNYTIGWLQSWAPEKGRFATWASLSRDAITDNNNRIEELASRLISSGRWIIGFNTDGIWYQGDIYHGDGEGPGLGEWENDHTNCRFRAKSNGAYEFIENGEYHAVVRGSTTLDGIEPDRSKWQWGDIYKTGLRLFKFDKDKGVYHEDD